MMDLLYILIIWMLIFHSLMKSKLQANKYEVEIKFKGCSKAGLCYAQWVRNKLYFFEADVKEQVIEPEKTEVVQKKTVLFQIHKWRFKWKQIVLQLY